MAKRNSNQQSDTHSQALSENIEIPGQPTLSDRLCIAHKVGKESPAQNNAATFWFRYLEVVAEWRLVHMLLSQKEQQNATNSIQ